jgi:TolA-binding protein
MISKMVRKRPALGALAVVLLSTAAPALAQTANTSADAETRLRKVEAEVRALQRQVFPGGNGKYFTPEITPGTPATAPATAAVPASTPVTDLLARMDAVEAQLARLTAQGEENTNRITLLEAKLAGTAPTVTSPTVTPSIGAPVVAPPAASAPSVAPAPKPAAVAPQPKATAAKPVAAAKPSAQRIAAVSAIEKPQTDDAGEDDYNYGYRLWEAKFYPEAQQQLKLFVDKYPKHQRMSYARNLLGRAYLDDGKPREAAPWFLQNYQSDKTGPRAADSLLFLADSMNRLKDTSRACIALAEFGESYPREAAGRLKTQYDATRSSAKCS